MILAMAENLFALWLWAVTHKNRQIKIRIGQKHLRNPLSSCENCQTILSRFGLPAKKVLAPHPPPPTAYWRIITAITKSYGGISAGGCCPQLFRIQTPSTQMHRQGGWDDRVRGAQQSHKQGQCLLQHDAPLPTFLSLCKSFHCVSIQWITIHTLGPQNPTPLPTHHHTHLPFLTPPKS